MIACKEEEYLNYEGGGNARIQGEKLVNIFEVDPKLSVVFSFG